jgi:fatty acid-binding protein DegV
MEEVPDTHIIVVDSLCATVGQGLMVYKAVQLKLRKNIVVRISR